jgi:hypothetical protein
MSDIGGGGVLFPASDDEQGPAGDDDGYHTANEDFLQDGTYWAQTERALGQKLTALRSELDASLVASAAGSRHPVDNPCLCRFLIASGGDVAAAAAGLCDTLAWRTEFGVESLAISRWDVIQTEALDGKAYCSAGRDRQGRPILMLRSANERTFDNKGPQCGNMVNLVYHMERTLASMHPQSDGKWTLVIDFRNYSILNAPPMSTSKMTIKIFQCYYPERLAVAILVDAPGLFRMAWKALSPFVDPQTKAKVQVRRCAVSHHAPRNPWASSHTPDFQRSSGLCTARPG